MTHRRWYEDRPFVYALLVAFFFLLLLLAGRASDHDRRITALEAKVNTK